MLCFTLFLLLLIRNSWQSNETLNHNEEDVSDNLIVYRNLNELLNFFRNDPSPLAKEILETFESECPSSQGTQVPGNPVHPLIVIEGNHRRTRNFVSRGLAGMLNARSVCHPAPCLRKYLTILPRGSRLRRVFFHLSNYAASRFIQSQPGGPTVINGYWSEQFAFTMAHHYPPGDLPRPTDDIFKHPEDMVRPDAIVYLNFADSHLNSYATTRNPWSWKPRTMEVMRALEVTQKVIFVETKPVMKLVTEEVYRHVQHLLVQRSTNTDTGILME